MSPEQVKNRGQMVDGRSDVFSLGVIFYEMLRSKRPFEATTRAELFEQILHRELFPFSAHDEDMPRELERICLKALSKGQRDRYSTASESVWFGTV